MGAVSQLLQISTTGLSRMTVAAFVAVSCCLLSSSSQAASITDDQDTCKAAAEQAGVDFENFKYNVGHVIHSLTVEDVRFFFDENFPIDNNIPTVNTNLIGPPLLPHTPSFPSKFKFPLGRTLDKILLNNDDTSSYSIRDFTSLEELAHAAHMYEMLFSVSKTFKLLVDVDSKNICPCIVDEESNGILDELHYLAEVFRFDNSKPLDEQTVRIVETCTNKNSTRKGRARQGFKKYSATLEYENEAAQFARARRAINVCPDVADIQDSTTWKNWQQDIGGPLEDEGAMQMSKNVALYLYCKTVQYY